MTAHVFLTSSGFFLVTNNVPDNVPSHRYINKYEKMNYYDFLVTPWNDPNINYEATSILNNEFPPQSFPFRYKNFRNGLRTLPKLPDIPNYTALFEYKSVSSDNYPMMIKRLGYLINKDIRDIYVEFNEDGFPSYMDENKKSSSEIDDFLGTYAYITEIKLLINLNMPRYIIKNEDYQKYLEIENRAKNDPNYKKDLSWKDKNIHKYITKFLADQRSYPLSLAHEIRHQINRFHRERLQLKKDAKQLSCEDIYRINAEDERSAKFSEILLAVNTYFKTGNTDLLNICKDLYPWLKNALEGKSTEETKTILSDHRFLLNETLSFWNKSYSYDNQFSKNCPIQAEAYCTLPEDTNHEEFNKQRKALFTFDVYNPITKKIESKDFSKLIDVEVEINDSARATIEQCEINRLDARKKILKLLQDPNHYGYGIIWGQQALRRKIHCMDGDIDTRLTEPQTQKGSPKTKNEPKQEPKEAPTTNPSPKSEPQPTPTTSEPETTITPEPNPITEPKPENQHDQERYAQAKGRKETVYTTPKGAEILHQRYRQLHSKKQEDQSDQEKYAQAKGRKETVYTTPKGAEILHQRYRQLHSKGR